PLPFLLMLASVGRTIMDRTKPVTSRTVFEVGEQHELVTSARTRLAACVRRAHRPGWARGPARPGPGHGLAGSSPSSAPPVAGGHTWPTPYPVSQGASADRHPGTMVPGDDAGLGLLLDRSPPVLAAPPAGIGGIDRDHDEPGTIGHAGQPFP